MTAKSQASGADRKTFNGQGNSGHPQSPYPTITEGLKISLAKHVLQTSKFEVAQAWAIDTCEQARNSRGTKRLNQAVQAARTAAIELFDQISALPTHEAMRQAVRAMVTETAFASWVFDENGNVKVIKIPNMHDDPDETPAQRNARWQADRERKHAEYLRLVVDNAKPQPIDPDPDPDPEPEPKPKPQPPPPKHFTFKRFADIKLSSARNYLIKGLLPRRGMAVIWGPPKCGKSFFAFDIAMHIAIGQPYRDCRVQQGSVAYLALEGGGGFPARKTAWEDRNLGDHVDPNDVPFYLLHDMALDLINQHDALIACIREQIPEPPAVVFIDTLNRALNGDENSSSDMGNFISAADAITAALGCLTVIIHHCGIAKNRPRGHTSLAGAADAQIAVERSKDGIVTATVEYMKDGEDGAVITSKLDRVELGKDCDGDPLSSCIVVATKAAGAEPKLSKTQQFAFELLKRLIATIEVKPPADAAKAPPRVCLADTWRKEFYATYPAEKQDTKKKALLRVTLDLEEAGLITLFREFVWVREPETE